MNELWGILSSMNKRGIPHKEMSKMIMASSNDNESIEHQWRNRSIIYFRVRTIDTDSVRHQGEWPVWFFMLLQDINVIVNLARQQQQELSVLMEKLFDDSVEGLDGMKSAIGWFRSQKLYDYSDVRQICQLKETLLSIQAQFDARRNHTSTMIEENKKNTQDILLRASAQLKIDMNNNRVRQHIKELVRDLDTLTKHMLDSTSLGSTLAVFDLDDTGTRITDLESVSKFSGAMKLGIEAAFGGAVRELTFRGKLLSLERILKDDICKVKNLKNQKMKELGTYFDHFERRLRQTSGSSSTTDIVWFDVNIQTDENQYFANELSREFPLEKYQVILFDLPASAIEYILSNTERNVILMTSGSAGRCVIPEVGHYFNIKGIIIFCIQVDDHLLWANDFKKVLLVTSSRNEVVKEIKRIECGDIYFLINGFSLQDLVISLSAKAGHYLSTEPGGFLIEDLKCIDPDKTYHYRKIEELHNLLASKNMYANGAPTHFSSAGLYNFVDCFLEALEKKNSEMAILELYTAEWPFYYKIVNEILNRLDADLIELAGDYIKALRRALTVYVDATNKVQSTTIVKVYRGLRLTDKSLTEFLRKFKVPDVIIFPSFLSTSMDEATAKSFAGSQGVVLEISTGYAQTNKPKNLSAVSAHTAENEVLLNCFSVLKVKRITKITDSLIHYECILDDSYWRSSSQNRLRTIFHLFDSRIVLFHSSSLFYLLLRSIRTSVLLIEAFRFN